MARNGRTPALIALVGAGLAAAAVWSAVPAAAHAELVGSTPRDGAKLPAAPPRVTLTFTESISAQFVRVRLSGPGPDLPLTAMTSKRVVSVPVADQGPGRYRLDYRVVSADGHPVSGELVFDVAAPTSRTSPTLPTSPTIVGATRTPTMTATAPPASTVANAASTRPQRNTGGVGAGPALGVLVVVAASVALGVAAILRRRGSGASRR